jgi:hypothetical protein
LLAAGLLAVGLASPLAAQTKSKSPPDKADTKRTPPPLVEDILINSSGREQTALINAAVEKLWKDNKVQPADRCSDYEFIRRASLDLIGRIAKVEEIDKFMHDPEAERRSRLIERLLESDEYAAHMANIWTTLLLTRSAEKVHRDQLHLWLFEQFQPKDSAWDKTVSELLTATGKTDDNGAVNFILAHLGEEIKDKRNENGRFEMVPVTSRTTRLFLGLRTQCTQCHDHPFNDEWKQAHFWAINAFFRQVDAPLGRPGRMMAKKDMARNRLELVDNASFNSEGIVPYERRIGVLLYTPPKFLDGTRIPRGNKKTRRQVLAQLVTKSPYFSKAFINRTWGHLYGRGMYIPTRDVDDFGEHNPVALPEVLDKLAEDWSTRFNHNPRDLMRWICMSKPYGLSSVANPTNTAPETEAFFSRMLLKAMSPEQLFESLMLATQSKAAASSEQRKKKREEWMKKLVVNFGDDEGNEITFNGTVVQALMLMNGAEINEAIMDKEYGTVAHVLKQKGITRDSVRYLFLAALNRPPTAAEYQRLLSPRMINMPRAKRPQNAKEQAEYWAGFYQDLFWAVLNSSEFFLNH